MDDDFKKANADASQARHSERIKTERAVMDAYGVSRSEARAALQSRAAAELAKEKVERQPLEKAPAAAPAEIKTETTAFQVRQLNPVEPPKHGVSGVPNIGGLVVVGLDVNGVPGKYESYGKNLVTL